MNVTMKARCSICYALCLVSDIAAHEAWHRTLTNVPHDGHTYRTGP